MGRRIYIGLIVFLFATGFTAKGQENSNDSDYQYVLIEAVKQKNLGNLNEAAKLYRLVINSKPDCDVAYYELGTIYLVSRQHELAAGNLKKAYELNRDEHWYTMAYLNALSMLKDYEGMKAIIQEKMKAAPGEVEWEYQLASVYASEGQYKKAVRIAEKIEKKKGFSEKITLLKASIYEEEGKYEKALGEIEKMLSLFPEAIQFRVVAAELCLNNGMEDRAAGFYREILVDDSTNIFALTNLTEYHRKREEYGKSLHYLGKSFENQAVDLQKKVAILSYYLSEGDYVSRFAKELEIVMETIIANHGSDPRIYLLASDFYIQTRKYDSAYYRLEKYLGMEDGNYGLHMQAVMLANASSLNMELLEASEKAIRLYPDSADLRFFRAIAYYEAGQHRDLIACLDSAELSALSSPDYRMQAMLLMAEACYRIGENGRSDSIFETLIREDPQNDAARNNYAYYLAERNEKLEQALELSGGTVDRNPDNSTFLDTYAWILFRLERYSEAEKYILKALDKGGENDPEVNEHAAEIQMALGSFSLAKAYFTKAIILGGDKEKLEEKMSGINE